MKFTPVIGLKNLKSCRTLEAAFRIFHAEVSDRVKKVKGPTVSVGWLNSCWIESSGRALPYFFDELVLLAHDMGWLKAGKIVPVRMPRPITRR